jgi:hypothetical protein
MPKTIERDIELEKMAEKKRKGIEHGVCNRCPRVGDTKHWYDLWSKPDMNGKSTIDPQRLCIPCDMEITKKLKTMIVRVQPMALRQEMYAALKRVS